MTKAGYAVDKILRQVDKAEDSFRLDSYGDGTLPTPEDVRSYLLATIAVYVLTFLMAIGIIALIVIAISGS